MSSLGRPISAGTLGQPLFEDREHHENALQVGVVVGLIGEGGAHLQVFKHRHARKDAPSFGHQRNAAPRDFVRREPGDLLAIENHLAATGARGAEQGHHQGRFAGPVGADQGDDLADFDVEVDPLEGVDVSVMGVHTRQAQHAHCIAPNCVSTGSSSPR
jgi:hypothetical protein